MAEVCWRRQCEYDRLSLRPRDPESTGVPVTSNKGGRAMADFTYPEIAKMLDHSLLQPVLTDAELEQGCRVARDYEVASVCIKPYGVGLAAKLLAGSSVAVGTTIGFPHGGHQTAIKAAEAERALIDGSRVLAMVVNIGKVLSGDVRFVWDGIC